MPSVDHTPEPSRSLLSRLRDMIMAVVMAAILLGGGGVWLVLGGQALAGALTVRTWEARTCEVHDVRVIEHRPWKNRVRFRPPYEVRFDLVDWEDGTPYRDATVGSGNAGSHDKAGLDLIIMPRAPGSVIDCWVPRDRGRAVVQQDPLWLIVLEAIGLLFAVVFCAGGVMMIRPSLVQSVERRVDRWLEHRKPREQR